MFYSSWPACVWGASIAPCVVQAPRPPRLWSPFLRLSPCHIYIYIYICGIPSPTPRPPPEACRQQPPHMPRTPHWCREHQPSRALEPKPECECQRRRAALCLRWLPSITAPALSLKRAPSGRHVPDQADLAKRTHAWTPQHAGGQR